MYIEARLIPIEIWSIWCFSFEKKKKNGASKINLAIDQGPNTHTCSWLKIYRQAYLWNYLCKIKSQKIVG